MRRKKPMVTTIMTILISIFAFTNGIHADERSRSESPVHSVNNTFDFSGIEQFWRIVDILETDLDPSAAQWDSLLNTAGYRALTASEFKPEFFVKYFSLAFKPSLHEELKTAMENPAKRRLLQHYLEVRDTRAELNRHQAELQSERVMAKILKKTHRFLPKEIPPADPPVAFVIFDNDGRGYDPIVIDLLSSLGRGFEFYLAHESHHWYRNRYLGIDRVDLKPWEESLFGTLNQIQAEGIADQIDKARWVDHKDSIPESWRGYAERFLTEFHKSAQLISVLDSLIDQLSAAPDDQRQHYAGKIEELVPMSGHPTGFYMARVIIEEFGEKRLAADFANPFAFCRTYDEAARRSDKSAPSFSATTLSLLESLESNFNSGRDS